MLTRIVIKNFIIVKNLTLDFNAGLNVLTGETGAGKSLWVDAIMLALGARAESHIVKDNTAPCDISCCFDVGTQAKAKNWLQQHDFGDDDDCIIRRIIQPTGKSKCSINGIPCSQNLLRQLAPLCLQIHNQHQQHNLLQRDQQRLQLDAFAAISREVNDLHLIYKNWAEQQRQLEALQQQAKIAEQELAFVNFQLAELDALNCQEGEWQQISAEHLKCHQAKQFITHIHNAREFAANNDPHNAESLVQHALAELEQVDCEDQALTSIRECLNTAAIHLQEANTQLQHYHSSLDLSPEHLNELEQRLSRIHDCARKHHVNPEHLHEVHKSLQQRAHDLSHIDTRIEILVDTQAASQKQYQRLAKKISAARTLAAKKLSSEISKKIQGLGMEAAELRIDLIPLESALNPYGQEEIGFTISTNRGQSPQPLAKVVSGGELSRISLAFEATTAEHRCLPTLIFDEIDVGIGGHTANTVGQLLRQLGEQSQILCITHLPQVAACAHHHYKVSKHTKATHTETSLCYLSAAERQTEIARMHGADMSIA